MNIVDERKTEGISGGAENSEQKKVVFTPEQQAKVQELIDDTYKKAYTKAKTGAGVSEEVEALKKEVEKFSEERKSSAVLRAVARHNVIDPEEVTELISRHAGVDSAGRVVAKAGNEDLSMEEFVDRWLSERPHHLRAAGSQGAGSQGVKFGGVTRAYNPSDPNAIRTMPREEFEKLLKQGVNVHGSGGQVFRFKNNSNPFTEARKAQFAKK